MIINKLSVTNRNTQRYKNVTFFVTKRYGHVVGLQTIIEVVLRNVTKMLRFKSLIFIGFTAKNQVRNA